MLMATMILPLMCPLSSSYALTQSGIYKMMIVLSQCRFLSFNHNGRITLTAKCTDNENSSDHTEKIEIFSDVAGPGRRKQAINTSVARYNLASIGT